MNNDDEICPKSAAFNADNGLEIGVPLREENNDCIDKDKSNNFEFIFGEWVIIIFFNPFKIWVFSFIIIISVMIVPFLYIFHFNFFSLGFFLLIG